MGYTRLAQDMATAVSTAVSFWQATCVSSTICATVVGITPKSSASSSSKLRYSDTLSSATLVKPVISRTAGLTATAGLALVLRLPGRFVLALLERVLPPAEADGGGMRMLISSWTSWIVRASSASSSALKLRWSVVARTLSEACMGR